MSCAPWLSRGVRWRRRDRNDVTTIAEGGGGGERFHRDSFTPFSDSSHRECEEEKVGSYRRASSIHNKSPFRYVSSNNHVSLHGEASSNNHLSPSTKAGYSIHNETRYRKAGSDNQNNGSSLLLLQKQGGYECNSNSSRRNSCGHTTIEEGEGRVSPYHRRCTPPTLRPQFSAFSEEEPQHAAEGNASTSRSRRSRNNTESSAISSSSSNSRSSSRSAAVVNADNNNSRARRPSSSRGGRGRGSTTAGKHKKDTNTDIKRGGHAEKSSNSKVTAPTASSHSSSSSQKDATVRGVSVVRSTVARKLRISPRDEVFSPRTEKKTTLQQMKTGGEEEEGEVEKQKKEAPSRRTSVSLSSGPMRGRRGGSTSREEGSYATSEETAAHAATVGSSLSKNTSRATGEEATGSVYCGESGRGRGGGGGGRDAVGENDPANESEEGAEEGKKSPLTAGAGNSRYFSRHSTVMVGRRRTGRLSERWSSAFLRSRRSALLPEDSIPVMLPMSQTDWIIVDRLSRKINSSNFATVLKAYLIIKTRVAAQRANKEYSQSQRKGRPGAALRFLLNRQNNRVALRMRAAGDARGGEDATTAAPSLSTQAEAAANATAATTVKAATVITRDPSEGSSVANTRPNSQAGDGASYTSGRNMGATSRPGGSKGEGSEKEKAGQQEDLDAAARVAASAGGGSIIGRGVLGETCDVSLASASVTAADASSAAGASGNTQRRDPQNRLKAVGVVGRMQAHQSLLEQRLAFLGLRSVYINGDGNCLFRSCSYNLYGTEEHHRYVRLHATQHMRSAAHQKDYSIFFECESEFDTYLKNMQRLGTWGDELCVRAIADSFECTIHIITSTDSNWYLRYDPQIEQPSVSEEDKQQKNEEKGGREGSVGESAGDSSRGGQYDNVAALTKSGTTQKHIFLTYISPIHYNAFTIAEESAPGSQSE